MLVAWLQHHRAGLLLGLALTLVGAGLHLAGITRPLELFWYDAHVRGFSSVPADPRILHIDIDDDALELVASWPWPRDMQASLIRILHELGAARVVMDITWTEPKGIELRVPGLDPYADLERDFGEHTRLSAENLVRLDAELAAAVRDGAPVHLAMFYEELRHRSDAPAEQEPAAGSAAARRTEIISKTREVLATRPAADVRETFAAVIGGDFAVQNADRKDLTDAWELTLGLSAVRSGLAPMPEGLRDRLPVTRGVNPPVHHIAAAARACGFVNFEEGRDRPEETGTGGGDQASGGILRHIPLLVRWEDRLIEQLGFTAASDMLDIRPEDLSIAGRHLRIAGRGDRAAMEVQLDEHGQMLLNWHTAGGDWTRCFQHMPVARLMQIDDARGRRRENLIRRGYVLGDIIRVVSGDSGYNEYAEKVNRMLVLERTVRAAELDGAANTPEVAAARTDAEALRAELTVEESEAVRFAREEWGTLRAEPDPTDPAIAEDYARFHKAAALIEGDLARLDAANRELTTAEQEAIADLGKLVKGQVCFVGYTATAVADMVTTPAYGRMPGVLVHSNLLNDFLTGRFRSWSPLWLQGLIIVMIGGAVTVLASTFNPRNSLLMVLSATALLLAVNALLIFRALDYWLPLMTALMVGFVIWAMIVLLRFLVTDRQRRRFSKALAQYVSPAVARQLAGSAAQVDLSPAAGYVSCFFSDLAGFTTISERLGPEGTRRVLNPYLEAMSEVLHRRQALINKFIGDGIFAFLNPPILPVAGHERAACEAALDSQQALDALIARHRDDPMSADFARLHMRIGVTSGPVFVGDYGSEAKLDYTCMGDTVNLAARLESANKQFGTRIMIAGPTRDAAGAGFVWRRLGRLQVKGQTVGVPVFELIGRAGEVDERTRDYADTFGAGVEAFTHRDWSSAAEAFERCAATDGADIAVRRYLELIETYRVSPPADEWAGVIELSEK